MRLIERMNASRPPRDVETIFGVVSVLALGVMLWGCVLLFGKATGLTMRQLCPPGLAILGATCIGVVILPIAQFHRSGRRIEASVVAAMLTLVVLASFAGWVRYRDVTAGSDVLEYLAGPAYFAAHPDEPLGFDMRPFLVLGDTGPTGYWIPYTFEYLLGVISMLSGVPIHQISLACLPAGGAFLFVFVMYAVIRSFGAAPMPAVSAGACSFLLALGDGGINAAWGWMGLGRLYENKGWLFAIFLPALIVVTWLASRYRPWQWRLYAFLLASAPCFMTANAIYLVPVTGLAALFAAWVARMQARATWSNGRAASVAIAVVVVPLLMFGIVTVTGGPSVYQFVDAASFGFRNDAFLRFLTHPRIVFGAMNVATLSAIGLAVAALIAARSHASRFLLVVIGVLLTFVVNVPLFELLKWLGIGEYRVYWRFLLWFPVALLPAFAIGATAASNARARQLTLASLVLGISGAILQIAKHERPYAVQVVTPQRIDGFQDNHRDLHYYQQLGIDLDGKYILGPPVEELKAALFAPGIRPMVGLQYFLAWQGAVLDRRSDVIELINAQRFVSEAVTDPSMRGAFARVLERYRPGALIVAIQAAGNPGLNDVIAEHGMRRIQSAPSWSMYCRAD